MSKRKVSYWWVFFKYLFLAASSLSWGRRDRVVPETEPWPLHWKVDFSPLGHQKSPTFFFFFFLILISLLPSGCHLLQEESGGGGSHPMASLGDQMVKNLSAVRETGIHSLSQEDVLEKGRATHSSILAWRAPMDRGAWWAAVHGVTKSRTRLCATNTFILSHPKGRPTCVSV